MFSSRRVLSLALTVVIVLAMLVPAAMAAPEWVHGVNITSPTQAAPAYVNPRLVPTQATFKVKYDLTILGIQVDDIRRPHPGDRCEQPRCCVDVSTYIVATTGLTAAQTSASLAPMASDGWYDLQVCVQDLNNPWPTPPTSDVFCDEEKNAVLIDSEKPGAELIKPVDGAVASGDYLMVGKAWDPAWAWNDPFMQYGGIAETWFDYCAFTNWQPIEWLVRAEGRELDQARRRNKDCNSAGTREGSTSSPGTRPRCLTTTVLFGSARMD